MNLNLHKKEPNFKHWLHEHTRKTQNISKYIYDTFNWGRKREKTEKNNHLIFIEYV